MAFRRLGGGVTSTNRQVGNTQSKGPGVVAAVVAATKLVHDGVCGQYISDCCSRRGWIPICWFKKHVKHHHMDYCCSKTCKTHCTVPEPKRGWSPFSWFGGSHRQRFTTATRGALTFGFKTIEKKEMKHAATWLFGPHR